MRRALWEDPERMALTIARSDWYAERGWHVADFFDLSQVAEQLAAEQMVYGAEPCPTCLGEGWVCENHPEQPWNEGEPACCGGAGVPCACNSGWPPAMPPGTEILWRAGEPMERLMALLHKPRKETHMTQNAPAVTHPGRFSYVAYDDVAKAKQEEFKKRFEELEAFAAESLPVGRAMSLFLTSLEEAYMWTGKAIRDEQIARGSKPEHVPGRSNE